LQDTDNQNVGTKSYILAPFNSSLKNNDKFLDNSIIIENDVIKIIGKAKEANRLYELNNNGEIDNGILINHPEEVKENNNIISNRESPLLSPMSNSINKENIFKPASPPNEPAHPKSNIPSPKEGHKKKESSNNNLAIYIDENIVKIVEEIGFKKEFILSSLKNNELNYAVAAYYLFLNSTENS